MNIKLYLQHPSKKGSLLGSPNIDVIILPRIGESVDIETYGALAGTEAWDLVIENSWVVKDILHQKDQVIVILKPC